MKLNLIILLLLGSLTIAYSQVSTVRLTTFPVGSCDINLLTLSVNADITVGQIVQVSLGLNLALNVEILQPNLNEELFTVTFTTLGGLAGGQVTTYSNVPLNTCIVGQGAQPDFFLSQVDDGFGGEDPHFCPLSANRTIARMCYMPKAKRKGVYNIITNKLFQWNSYWGIFPGAWGSSNPQYILREGFTIRNPLQSMVISSIEQVRKEKGKQGDQKIQEMRVAAKEVVPDVKILFDTKLVNGKGHLIVKINMVDLENVKQAHDTTKIKLIPTEELLKQKYLFFGPEFPFYYISLANYNFGVINTPFFSVKFLVKTHQIGKKTVITYFNNKIQMERNKMTSKSHGILGQTISGKYYKEPRIGCVECFVKGSVEEYREKNDDLFGKNFTFNRFN